jgi:hypothetical protein
MPTSQARMSSVYTESIDPASRSDPRTLAATTSRIKRKHSAAATRVHELTTDDVYDHRTTCSWPLNEHTGIASFHSSTKSTKSESEHIKNERAHAAQQAENAFNKIKISAYTDHLMNKTATKLKMIGLRTLFCGKAQSNDIRLTRTNTYDAAQ